MILVKPSVHIEDEIIGFNFNFHFHISSLTEFKEKIDSNPILDLKKIAIDIMKGVYGLELDKGVDENA